MASASVLTPGEVAKRLVFVLVTALVVGAYVARVVVPLARGEPATTGDGRVVESFRDVVPAIALVGLLAAFALASLAATVAQLREAPPRVSLYTDRVVVERAGREEAIPWSGFSLVLPRRRADPGTVVLARRVRGLRFGSSPWNPLRDRVALVRVRGANEVEAFARERLREHAPARGLFR